MTILSPYIPSLQVNYCPNCGYKNLSYNYCPGCGRQHRSAYPLPMTATGVGYNHNLTKCGSQQECAAQCSNGD